MIRARYNFTILSPANACLWSQKVPIHLLRSWAASKPVKSS